jgi:hypothetical protein
MNRTSTFSLFAVVAVAVLVFLAPQAETHQKIGGAQGAQLQQPFWDSVKIDDNTDTMLLKVEAGKRFVLTDMWFLSVEGEHIEQNPYDRVWLESRVERKRLVIFDSPLLELSQPLRWNTGVAIRGGQELWIGYKANPSTDVLRRVHFTGYFEADLDAASY